LSENFLKVWLKRDSRDGPIRSITRTLNSPKTKNKFTFCRTVVNVGNSLVDNCGIIVEVVVKLAFIYQLGVFGIDGFYLHCNFKIGLGVDCLINLSEGPFINLSDDFEVLADLL
jgi:hypothetical protein